MKLLNSNDPESIFLALTLLRNNLEFRHWVDEHEPLLNRIELDTIFEHLENLDITSCSIGYRPDLILFPCYILKRIVEEYETNRNDSD